MTAGSTSSFYLCVDCGGTKTSAVICNSAAVVTGRALGGPSNFSYLGLQPFLKVLKATVEKALAQTISSSVPVNVSTTSWFTSAWIAVSGVDSPSDIRILTSELSQLFSIPQGSRLQVTNDAHLLASPLRVHHDLESAVAVIAGTGSVVVSFSKGSNPEDDGSLALKEMARAGGWGWILGDAGSGFEVGREAVREILLRADRDSVKAPAGDRENATEADAKTLKSRILSHFGITNVPDIFTYVYAPDPPPVAASSATFGTTNISNESGAPASTPQGVLSLQREHRLSQLAPLVFRSAFEDQDDVALIVLRNCARGLAHQIAMLLSSPSDLPSESPNAVKAARSVLCLGGSLVGVPKYRDLILDELKTLGQTFAAVEYVGGGDVAAAGAIGLAMAKAAGAS